MVPEVHEWTASVSFLRQLNIIQVTLQGMWTFLMSEDFKLQLICVQMGFGEYFSTPMTSLFIFSHGRSASLPSSHHGLGVPGASSGSKLISLIMKCLDKGLV